ncbi:hypothetical protein F2Q68_00016585 [Brassica cretica]|uniref:Uncharacterized protein n=1 Tax=Brassica cretica TaxID=69181 RepID=A0A8S9HKI4_BRACR|nr:hypothetical protein F2Q68_00016585 [Brassica cretica]
MSDLEISDDFGEFWRYLEQAPEMTIEPDHRARPSVDMGGGISIDRGANEKEKESFRKRVFRIPLDKPFDEAYYTHRLWMFFRETRETEEDIRKMFSSHCGAEYETEYSASIETHTATSIDSHHQILTNNAYFPSIDTNVDATRNRDYSIGSWAYNRYHESYAVETTYRDQGDDEHIEEFTYEELLNMQRRDETDQNQAASAWERTRFSHPIDRESCPSIDINNTTSIDIRPKPKTTVSEKDKSDNQYLTPDEFGIFRNPDGYARAIDGRTLHVSREDIADILQTANGAGNLFIHQRNIPEHKLKATKEFYNTAGGINKSFKQRTRHPTQPSIDVDAPTSVDRMPEFGRRAFDLLDGHTIMFTTEISEDFWKELQEMSQATYVFLNMQAHSHRTSCRFRTSIDNRIPASVDANPPHPHSIKSEPNFYTRAEIDQIVEGIYRALESTEEKIDGRCDDIYFPMDLSISSLTSMIEAIQGEFVEIQSYIAHRPEASPSIDRRNSKSTNIHQSLKPHTTSRRINDPGIIAASHCGAEYETEYSASIETHTATSIDSHHQILTNNAYFPSIDTNVDATRDRDYSIGSWAYNRYHESYAVETTYRDQGDDELIEEFTYEELLNMQRRDETCQNQAASAWERTCFSHTIDRESRPSIDINNTTSIDIRPKPKTTVSEKDKSDNQYLIPDKFGIFRNPDGYARAIDGRTLHVSREDIADILQTTNGADNLFIHQRNIPEHKQKATKEFYNTAGGTKKSFKQRTRHSTQPSIDVDAPTSVDRMPEFGRRAFDLLGTRRFYWEGKDEYGIYRDDQGYARDQDGHTIHVHNRDIRRLLERASRDEPSYICLPEHASSFTQTKLVPEIYTKDEIDEMFYGYQLADDLHGGYEARHSQNSERDRRCLTYIDRQPLPHIERQSLQHIDRQPHTSIEIDQIVEGIYRALESTKEKIDGRCDDIYFPMDLSISALTSMIEAIQGEFVEIQSYVARRPKASPSIDRRNSKSTNIHQSLGLVYMRLDSSNKSGRSYLEISDDFGAFWRYLEQAPEMTIELDHRSILEEKYRSMFTLEHRSTAKRGESPFDHSQFEAQVFTNLQDYPYMSSSTRSSKETQLLFSPDPASLERSIGKEARSSSIDNTTCSSIDFYQPPSTQTLVPSTDTHSPLSTEDTHLPSTDIDRYFNPNIDQY